MSIKQRVPVIVLCLVLVTLVAAASQAARAPRPLQTGTATLSGDTASGSLTLQAAKTGNSVAGTVTGSCTNLPQLGGACELWLFDARGFFLAAIGGTWVGETFEFDGSWNSRKLPVSVQVRQNDYLGSFPVAVGSITWTK